MHDVQRWTEAKQLWERATALAPHKTNWYAQSVFMTAYVADHTRNDHHMTTLAKRLADWNNQGKELPPLHPWMSLHLPLPPAVRLSMASGFALALRVDSSNRYGQLLRTSAQLLPGARKAFAETGRVRVGMLSADFKDKVRAVACLMRCVT